MIPKEIIKVTLRGLHSSREFGLDILLGQAPTASASRQQKLEWLRQLVNWIRADRLSTKTVRLRMVIQVLNRNPELMDNVSSTLRSIIRETRSLELFMNVGIPSQHGFVGECFDRLSQIFLPQHLEHHDLISVFSTPSVKTATPDGFWKWTTSSFRNACRFFTTLLPRHPA